MGNLQLEGNIAYWAAIPAVAVILLLRVGWWRTIVALGAVAHLVILASVALFPIPVDPALIAEARAGSTAEIAVSSLNLVPFSTIGPVLAGMGAPGSTRLLVLNAFVSFRPGSTCRSCSQPSGDGSPSCHSP